MSKKVRFFLKRSSKVEIGTKKPIIIPFQLATTFLLFLMILISAFLFLRSDIFQIKDIEVGGTVGDCSSEESLKLASEAVGVSIIFYDTARIQKKLLEKFYCLADVKFTKNYPSNLIIEVFPRIPVAAIAQIDAEPTVAEATGSASLRDLPISDFSQSSPSAFFAIDREGVLFKNLATTSALPKVHIGSPLMLGNQISQQEILWLLDFLTKSEAFNLNFDEFVKTKDGTIVGKTRNGLQIILSSQEEAGKTASSLQAILRQAKIEGAKFKILDLRFEKPILK